MNSRISLNLTNQQLSKLRNNHNIQVNPHINNGGALFDVEIDKKMLTKINRNVRNGKAFRMNANDIKNDIFNVNGGSTYAQRQNRRMRNTWSDIKKSGNEAQRILDGAIPREKQTEIKANLINKLVDFSASGIKHNQHNQRNQHRTNGGNFFSSLGNTIQRGLDDIAPRSTQKTALDIGTKLAVASLGGSAIQKPRKMVNSDLYRVPPTYLSSDIEPNNINYIRGGNRGGSFKPY